MSYVNKILPVAFALTSSSSSTFATSFAFIFVCSPYRIMLASNLPETGDTIERNESHGTDK